MAELGDEAGPGRCKRAYGGLRSGERDSTPVSLKMPAGEACAEPSPSSKSDEPRWAAVTGSRAKYPPDRISSARSNPVLRHGFLQAGWTETLIEINAPRSILCPIGTEILVNQVGWITSSQNKDIKDVW